MAASSKLGWLLAMSLVACSAKAPPPPQRPASSSEAPASLAPGRPTDPVGANPAFVPGGALPQHRGFLVDLDLEALQRTGDRWVWATARRVLQRSPDAGATTRIHTTTQDIHALAASPSGQVAIVADETLEVLGDAPRSLKVERRATVTWCDERLFVAGSKLSEVRGRKLVTVRERAGYLSPRSCAGGTLALRVEGGLELWSLADDRWTKTLAANEPHHWSAVAVAPDGRQVALVEHTGGVRLWTAQGKALGHLPAVAGQAVEIAFSPDGNWLAAGRVVLSVPTLRVAAFTSGSEVAWSGDGQRLAVYGGGHTIADLDVAGLLREPLPRGLAATARAMALDAERARLYTSDEDGQVLVWSLPSLAVVGGFHPAESSLSSGQRLALLPDGTLLAGAREHVVRWSPAGERLDVRGTSWPAGDAMSASADGRIVAVAASNEVHVIDWSTGAELLVTGNYKREPGEFDGSVEGVSVHPNGELVAIGGRSETHVLRVADGSVVAALDELPGYGNRVWFSPDGKRLLHVSSMGARLYAWPAMTGVALPEEAQSADHATFSADGDTLIVSGWNSELARIDLRGPPRTAWRARAPWHIGAHAVDFARRRVFSAGPDLRLSVWSLDDGHRVDVRAGGAGRRSTALSFSPSGRYLGSGNGEGAVHLFDLQQGTQLRQWLEEGTHEIEQVRLNDTAEATVFDGHGVTRLSPGKEARTRLLSPMAGSCGSLSTADGDLVFIDDDDQHLITVNPRAWTVHERPLPKVFRADAARLSPDATWWLEVEKVWSDTLPNQDIVRMIEVDTARVTATVEATVDRPGAHVILGWAGGAGWIFDGHAELQRWQPGQRSPERLPVDPTFTPMAIADDLVAGVTDDAVVVARLPSLEIVHVLPGHGTRIDTMAFSDDGALLASGDFRGRIWVWDTSSGRARARLMAGASGWNAWLAAGRWQEGGYPPATP